MPKIPLYNQGKGAAVQTAAGALSPRASAAVFTAPGQAQAAFAKQAGDVAFRFAEEQARAETNRVYSEELKTFDEQQLDFNLNNKDTDTTVYAKNYETFSNNFLNSLRTRTDLNDTQKEKIEQRLMPSITASRLQGTRQAFARGQDRRRIANNESLALITNKIGQTAIGSPERMRLETEAYGIIDESITDGLGIDYSRESFNRGVFAQDITMRSGNAKSLEEFGTLRNEIDDDVTLGIKTKETLKKKIAQDEDDYRANLLQSGVEVVQTAEFTFEEAELAQQKLDKGEAFTLGGQKFDPSDLKPTQRGQLASVIAGEQKDLEDLSSQNIQNSLSESDDIFVASTDLFKTENKQKYWQSDEQKETIILNAAEDLTERIVADITAGNVSNAQGLANDMQSVLNMINYDYRGAGSLLQREGSLGDTAATLQQRIAAAQKDLKKAVDKSNRSAMLQASLGKRDFNQTAMDLDATDAQKKQAVEDTMISLRSEEGEVFNQSQLNIASGNGVTWDFWKSNLESSSNLIADNAFDLTDDVTSDLRESFELYKAMKSRGNVLQTHASEDVLANFQALEILEPYYGFEGAIQQIRSFDQDIDRANVKYKEVEALVNTISEEKGTASWYSFIPFLGDSPEYMPVNKASMANDVGKLTKTLIRKGIDPEIALAEAATAYGKRHIRVRNIILPKTTDMPMANGEVILEEQVNSVINAILGTPVVDEFLDQKTANKRSQAEKGGLISGKIDYIADNYDNEDLMLIPSVSGSLDKWMLVTTSMIPVPMDASGVAFEVTRDQLSAYHDIANWEKTQQRNLERNKEIYIENNFKLGTGPFEGLSLQQKQQKREQLEGVPTLTITVEDLLGTKETRKEKINQVLQNWASQ